jgi:hypothetical protein
MKLRLLAALAGLAIATGAAQAQIGVYATPLVSRISNSTPDSTVFGFLGLNTTSRIFEGFGVGVYDDFLHSGGISVAGDVRASVLRGGGAQLNNFLFGARVSFKPVVFPLKPYVEVLAGIGGTRPAHNPLYVTKPEYGGEAGIEYPLGRRVDFRVISIGYTSLDTVNSSTVNTQATAPPASKLINFSTGLVFHFSAPHIPIP